MSSPNSNQWLVGYGTFITRGTWKRYPSCRVCRVPELRRVYDPKMAWFPFAIVDEQAEMLAVCFLVENENQCDKNDSPITALHSPLVNAKGFIRKYKR